MCLPCKEEEDSQMSTVAADFYADVISERSFDALDQKAPIFYKKSVNVQRGVMRIMIEHKLLNHEQVDRLRSYIQKFCYRADDLISWTQVLQGAEPSHVRSMSAKMVKWAKEDQEFFTALINEINDWYKYAKG